MKKFGFDKDTLEDVRREGRKQEILYHLQAVATYLGTSYGASSAERTRATAYEKMKRYGIAKDELDLPPHLSQYLNENDDQQARQGFPQP